MRGVFISYRRDDSSSIVDKIHASLRSVFNDLHVFVDTGGIEPGEDFPKVLQYHIEQDLVFLAVIGREWQGGANGKFSTRLQNPDDMVRREIEWRLRNWRSDIIPVLVNGALMPHENDLPEKMRGLTRLNSLVIPESDFASGIAILVRRIDQILEEDAKITSELNMLEEEAREQEELNPTPKDPPGPGVPAFQFEGTWTCDVQSPYPEELTGSLGHMLITFKVAEENTMTGSITWPGRKHNGRDLPPEPIEGEAFLFKEKHASIHGGDRFDRVWLQGIFGRTQSFTIEIPLHSKLGKVYHGSDPQGRQYALRLLKTSKTRFGF